MQKCIMFILSMFAAAPAFAKGGWIRDAGDFLQVIVPAYAAGMAVQEGGWDGILQFAEAFTATEITQMGLKAIVPAERPDHSDKKSFPSGHTAAAFSGATFMHKRYGWRRAVLPYAMASFVGFSRVYANKHYIWDVAAGAAIAGMWTWAFVDESPLRISAGPSGAWLGFRTIF
ncbi:MAG: phosphatase PAP2 family protein [Rickettsiales bacterium]|nr:phosphatase PAP2 family protein [Rickettsiales bacterium]